MSVGWVSQKLHGGGVYRHVREKHPGVWKTVRAQENEGMKEWRKFFPVRIWRAGVSVWGGQEGEARAQCSG